MLDAPDKAKAIAQELKEYSFDQFPIITSTEGGDVPEIIVISNLTKELKLEDQLYAALAIKEDAALCRFDGQKIDVKKEVTLKYGLDWKE